MFGLSSIVKLFKKGNVSVCGLRGTGKDMLFANVIARRKSPYISNINYKSKSASFIPLDVSLLFIGNTYRNFISGDINKYVYPYPEGADIYFSDSGIIFPSQYCNQLIREYPDLPVFCALSRHLADCNVHFNSQNLERMWDKFREQSDIYIMCNSCTVLFGFVFQRITIYDKYQSAVDRVQPFKRIRPRLLASKEERASILQTNELMRVKYANEYGFVKRKTLIYRNLSSYDTRHFKTLLSASADNIVFDK